MNAPLVFETPPLASGVVGRVGENLAAYYLEANGFECSIVDRRGADIWCRAPNGDLFELEVKASCTLTTGNRYHTFTILKKEADQYMLTCLDTNYFRIFSRDQINERMTSGTLHMKPAEFSEKLMIDDMNALKSTYMSTVKDILDIYLPSGA
jgi:hypothetical protein|tara:strand:- start:402 stop:857 length:456 start_codon:yes stop_codon:yes gene_type:complete